MNSRLPRHKFSPVSLHGKFQGSDFRDAPFSSRRSPEVSTKTIYEHYLWNMVGMDLALVCVTSGTLAVLPHYEIEESIPLVSLPQISQPK